MSRSLIFSWLALSSLLSAVASTGEDKVFSAAVAPFLSPDRLVHMVHSQSAWDPMLIEKMRKRGVGNVFVTDDVMENPYDRLPAYFDELCVTIAAANQLR